MDACLFGRQFCHVYLPRGGGLVGTQQLLFLADLCRDRCFSCHQSMSRRSSGLACLAVSMISSLVMILSSSLCGCTWDRDSRPALQVWTQGLTNCNQDLCRQRQVTQMAKWGSCRCLVSCFDLGHDIGTAAFVARQGVVALGVDLVVAKSVEFQSSAAVDTGYYDHGVAPCGF